MRYCPNCGLQKRAPHAVRHLFVAVIASIISYASRVSTDILTNIMPSSLRCCSRIFSAVFPSHLSSLHPGIPAHAPSFSPIIPRAIPHNSKCRYGERGAADAVPQLPERCLSRKAGIVRCCPRFLQENNAVHFPHPLLCSMVSSLSIHRASTSFSCSIKACPFSTGMQNTPVESASPRPLSLLTMATLFM